MRPGFHTPLSFLLVALLLFPSSPLLAAVPYRASTAAFLDVVINEVGWSGTAASTADEWIELYNNTASDIDLTGWTLVAADGSPSIDLYGTIPANGYYLLERTDDTTIIDIPADWWGSFGYGLSDDGETLTLRDAGSNVVDTANGDGGGWPAGSTTNRRSMERINAALPDTDANWASNDMVTHNGHAANWDPLNGTPKLRNSASSLAADLWISKSGPAQITAGSNVVYQLDLGNWGNLAADGGLVTDTLPIGVTFVSQVSSYPYTQPSPDVIVWDLGTVPLTLTSFPITLTGHVALTATGVLTNQVEIASAALEVTTTNNVAWAYTAVQAEHADVVVGKIGPATTAPDSLITYTLTISSAGMLDATAVRVTDTLPAGVAFSSQDSPYPYLQPAPETIVWTVGDLLTGTQALITLYGAVLPTATGTLANMITATTTASETNLLDNTALWQTVVCLPGGGVVINEVAWAGHAGYTSDEWIELYNPSPGDVNMADWTLRAADDTPWITLTGVITAGGYYLLERDDDDTIIDITANQTYTGVLGNAGEALTLRDALGTTVDTANGDGGDWPAGTSSPDYRSMERILAALPDADDNWAPNDMVTRNGLDAGGNPINGTPKQPNSATPLPAPDLAVSKTGPVTTTPGAQIAYLLAISNVGELAAPDALVTDTLPAGVAFLSSSYTATQVGQDVVWALGTVPPGGSMVIELYGQVAPTATGTLTNGLVAATSAAEPNLGNNAAAWDTTVLSVNTGDVVINEVAWAGHAGYTSDEWIELYNPSAGAVDLTGWSLRAADGSPAITLTGTVPAGGYYLLERGDDNTVSDILADLIYDGALLNDGESLTLRDALGTTVDTANGDGGDWPAGTASPNYQSMERILAALPDADDNWAPNDMVTRNGLDAGGNPINGTPKHRNSATPPPAPDLAVGKTGPVTTTPDTQVTYHLAISNIGELAAPDVRVTDTLPTDVAFVSQSSTYPFAFQQVAPNVLVWTAPSVPTGTVALITLHGQVAENAAAVLSNHVAVTTTAEETTLANNAASWETRVIGGAGRIALPLIYKNYRVRVQIHGVFYDGYLSNDPDEAVSLMNMGTVPVNLEGWELCKGVSGNLSCKALPAALIWPTQVLWFARDAAAFTTSFGYAPDYQMASWLSSGLANGGDEVVLRSAAGRAADALVYGDGSYTVTGWLGPAVDPYYGTNQLLHRVLDEQTGLPAADTDTAADWMQDASDPWRGRRALRPGWDLAFFQPLSVTEAASLTVAVAPDSGTEVLLEAIGQAQERIEIEIYTLELAGLVQALVDKAQVGVSVTVLLEGGPVGGVSDQERWACQQIEQAGGQCWFMFHDPGAVTATLPVHNRYDYLHAKLVLVDRQQVLISSQNATPSGLPDDDKVDGTWGSRGVLVWTNAPSVVARAAAILDADTDPLRRDLTRWALDNPYGYDAPPLDFQPITVTGGTTYTVQFPPLVVAEPVIGFEVLTSPESSLRLSDGLLGLVARAGPGDTVYVEQAYEYSTWGSEASAGPNLRLESYIAAAQRGARVRILLNGQAFSLDPAEFDKARATVAYVNDLAFCNGWDLQVRLGNPTGYGIHNKMVLVQAGGQGYAHIGSINGSETSSKLNRELAVQLRSDEVYAYLADVFAWDWAQTSSLLISEVVYDSVDLLDVGEWVEIYNPTAVEISLDGWEIGDAVVWGEYGSGRYRFPPGTTIGSYGLLVVAARGGEFRNLYGFSPDFEFRTGPDDPLVPNMVMYANWEGFGFALGNGGDEVALWNPAGEVEDILLYCGGTIPCPIGYPGVRPFPDDVEDPGNSLQRVPSELDTDYCDVDFQDTVLPTPGQFPAGYHECGD